MPAETKNILLADDEEHSRRILSHYLASWGYSVIEARDGLEAAAVFGSSDAPSMALVDWVMPGMDGIQLCQYIRQLQGRHYTYLILLTAKADKQEVAAGLGGRVRTTT